jgi:hypothetical protein
MASAWMQELEETSAASLQRHLDRCPACAAEMTAMKAMWDKLGDLPVPEPSLALRIRWEQTLQSLTEAPRPAPSRPAWWRSLWPANPAWQMAIAGLCLVAGMGAGALVQRNSGEREEVAQLRKEIAGTREMVAVSLLQQQSAAERLRGVDYSTHMPSMEPEVVNALIGAVSRDTSVNVRLAAIDALSKVANEEHVRESIQEALPREDSPMVQAALIDYLADAHDRSAVGAIQSVVDRPDVNPTVRQRATYAVSRLTQ